MKGTHVTLSVEMECPSLIKLLKKRKRFRGGKMKTGVVKWFNDGKGYGFIQDEQGKEHFVHYSSINIQGFKTLKEGQKVYFEAEDGPKGPCAKEVTLV